MTGRNDTLRADVVVIGSGLAGCAVAWEAARTGSSVLVLEKMRYFGGNSALSGGGYACWDSSLKLREKLNLGYDSPELHLKDTLKAGKYVNDLELAEIMVTQAPSGLDWLVSVGVPFKPVLTKLGGFSAYRSHKAAVDGKAMMSILRSAASDFGAVFMTDAPVSGFITDGRRVSGVRVDAGAGKRDVYAERAVVIASGGFGGDAGMREQFCRPELSALHSSNHRGATGEMILYARDVGAALRDMACVQVSPCASPSTGAVDRWAFYCYSAVGYGMIYTDAHGRRFTDELGDREAVSQAQLALPDRPTWAVFNREISSAAGMTGGELRAGLHVGRILCGTTAEELAAAMGADFAALAETIRLRDDALRSAPAGSAVLPLGKGPYYAIAQWPTVHYTMGGVRIDSRARVLRSNGEAILGLYAAGEVCGGVHGAGRLGGNALAECVVFGRIAGREALKEEQ